MEKDPLLEIQRVLQEIEDLIARPGAEKYQAKIGELINSLGVTSRDEFREFQRDFKTKVYRRAHYPLIPDYYPSLEHFKNNYSRLLREKPYFRPIVGNNITASELSAFAKYDWKTIGGRAIDIVTYTYNMGKAMCDELIYRDNFKSADAIKIDSNWEVTNGERRALTLRTLGRGFVTRSGMDLWVLAIKDQD